MTRFYIKNFFISVLFALTGLSISPGIVYANPPCYMVNQLGQTIDLSYLCHSNTVNNQQPENQEQERSFYNETAQESTKNDRNEQVDVSNFAAPYGRTYLRSDRNEQVDVSNFTTPYVRRYLR